MRQQHERRLFRVGRVRDVAADGEPRGQAVAELGGQVHRLLQSVGFASVSLQADIAPVRSAAR